LPVAFTANRNSESSILTNSKYASLQECFGVSFEGHSCRRYFV